MPQEMAVCSIILCIYLVGLVLGDRAWSGILNVDIVEDIVHLVAGGLLAYVGFSGMDLSTARSVVLALGIIYLIVGILGFIVPMMFGLIPDGYTIFDDLLHLVLGVLSLTVAFAAPRGTTQTGRSATARATPKAVMIPSESTTRATLNP